MMRRRELVSSDTSLGIGDHLLRPSDLPCPESPSMVDLTVFMSERMNVALNLLDPRRPREARRRLCAWWFDSSVYLRKSTACVIVRQLLRGLTIDEQAAAIPWFAGSWHADRTLMLRLLWRVQCSTYTVTGAALLHEIGSKEESRNEKSGLACSGK